MSLSETPANHPTGSRRLTLTMLTIRDRADAFVGAPAGSAKPLRLLAAFPEAEPYLGLPTQAYKLVSWEEGSRPITWPSARRQQEYLGLSAARVNTLSDQTCRWPSTPSKCQRNGMARAHRDTSDPI